MTGSPFSSVTRVAGVLILGTLGLHQLSYLLKHGAQAGTALAGDGHGYLTALAPALIVVALGLLVSSVAVSFMRPQDSPGAATRESRAALLAFAFLFLFVTQELVEGVFAAGHPQGLEALANSWIALPLALPVGALAALGLGGVRRAELLLAAPTRRRVWDLPPAVPHGGARREPRGALICLPLPFGLVRRGPPRVVRA